jgi:hypothetical protein
MVDPPSKAVSSGNADSITMQEPTKTIANQNLTPASISTMPPKVEAPKVSTPVQPSIDISKYGKETVKGMTSTDYNLAKSQKWVEVIQDGKPVNIDIDLAKAYNYADMEKIMFNLAKYDGVHLYKIGESEKGRNLYSINIDFGSDLSLVDGELSVSPTAKNKEVIMTSAGVHARETAGSIFLLKQLNDLVEKAQTDPYTRTLLQNVIYVSVPCINPDGREMVIAGAINKKSNVNGVDINRNFPSMNGGLLNNGTKRAINIALTPGDDFFPGYTLGSESETRALMKWMDNFVPIADSFVDYHQQGGIVYRVKDWNPAVNKQEYNDFSKNIISFLNKGVTSNKYVLASEPFVGINGVGGTITDYASSVALGQTWSNAYGRMVYKDASGKEIPLIVYDNMDKIPYKPINKDFVTNTIEMTRSRSALGYGSTARSLQRYEYNKYNFADLFTKRAELALGSKRVQQIKDQAKMVQSMAFEDDEEENMTKSIVA